MEMQEANYNYVCLILGQCLSTKWVCAWLWPVQQPVESLCLLITSTVIRWSLGWFLPLIWYSRHFRINIYIDQQLENDMVYGSNDTGFLKLLPLLVLFSAGIERSLDLWMCSCLDFFWNSQRSWAFFTSKILFAKHVINLLKLLSMNVLLYNS